MCSDIIRCATFALRMLVHTAFSARHGVYHRKVHLSHWNGPTIDNMCGQEQPRLQEWARNNQACENDPGTGQERAKNRPGTAQISTRARMHERFICRTRPQDKAYPRDKKLKWFCVSTEYHYPVASIQLKIYTNSMNIPDRLLSPAKSWQE